MAHLFPVDEPFGLGANVLKVAHGCGECEAEPLAPGLTQRGGLLKVLFGLVAERRNGLT
jgi:hypothetical protein